MYLVSFCVVIAPGTLKEGLKCIVPFLPLSPMTEQLLVFI